MLSHPVSTDHWDAFDDLRAAWEEEHRKALRLERGRDRLRTYAILTLSLLPALWIVAAALQPAGLVAAAIFTGAWFAGLVAMVLRVEHRIPRPPVSRVIPQAALRR